MLSYVILPLVLLFFAFFFKYKRDLFMRILSLDTAKSTRELQEQLRDTGDDIIRKMSDQVVHMEYLLEEADQKIVLLEKKLAAAEELMPETSSVVWNTAPPAPAQVISAYTHSAISGKNQDALPSAPFAAAVPTASSDFARETPNGDKRRVITAMAEQGYNVTEIAKATGIGKGEIMLLLQLSKQQPDSVPEG